jgi:hypothetical protein
VPEFESAAVDTDTAVEDGGAHARMRAFTPLSWRPVLLLPAASASQAAWRSSDGSGSGAGPPLKQAPENLCANFVPGEDGAGAGPAAAATPGVANKSPAAAARGPGCPLSLQGTQQVPPRRSAPTPLASSTPLARVRTLCHHNSRKARISRNGDWY